MINLAPVCEAAATKAIECPSLNYAGCTVKLVTDNHIECCLNFSDGSILAERYEWPLGAQGLEVVEQLVNDSIAKIMQGRLDLYMNMADENVCH